MTENFTPDAGRAAIDAYLDSVEQALMAAHAPRSDRLQVLQDLESQIADMLARESSPLTEEAVRSVIGNLEPPSHFADTYGNAAGPISPPTRWFTRLPHIRWPVAAALCCGMLILGCVLAMLEVGLRTAGPILDVTTLLIFLGLFLTPIALWKAFRQLQLPENGRHNSGRELVLKSTVVYCTLVPALLMCLAIAITRGYILFPIGIAAFVYLQYMLIRRLWRYMSEVLPPQRAPAGNANGNGASSPMSSAAPMPAM